jgi:galactokinase
VIGPSTAPTARTARALEYALQALHRATHAPNRAGAAADRPARAFFVPGRIEVLGKHTDYAGGRSLLAAMERGFTIVATPRDDDLVAIIDADSRQRAAFHLDPELRPIPGGWRNYPMTVARRLAQNFPDARTGADIAFTSDLPSAAGLSSSSALVVGIFLALATINRLAESGPYREWIRTPADLADYLGAVENGHDYRGLTGDRGVGTRGGSQDQTAILCARPGALVQCAFGPVRLERELPLPPGHTFAIACSGVRASKTGGALVAYNRAAAEAARLLQLWREGTGREDRYLGTALESAPDARQRLHALIAAARSQGPVASGAGATQLAARLEQFATEALQLIPAAGDALAAGELATFGDLVDRSQRHAETGLRNQVDETITLQRAARELGAVAASAFGAGFGGSVWALVPEAEATTFLERWRERYQARCPGPAEDADFFLTRAAEGARRIL